MDKLVSKTSITLYLDEDVPKKIAIALRLRGFDVISAHEINKRGISDSDQLNHAVTAKRAIFSFNIRDYIELYKTYLN